MSQNLKTALFGLLAFTAGLMSSHWSPTTSEAAPHGQLVAQKGSEDKALPTGDFGDPGIMWQQDGDTLHFTSTDSSRSFLIFGSPPGVDDGLEFPDLTFVFTATDVKSNERSMVFEMVPVFDCKDICLPCDDPFSGCIDPRPPPEPGPIRWQAAWMDPTEALPFDPREGM